MLNATASDTSFKFLSDLNRNEPAKRFHLRFSLGTADSVPCLDHMVCFFCDSDAECSRRVDSIEDFSLFPLTRFGSKVSYSCPLGEKFHEPISKSWLDSQEMACDWDTAWRPRDTLYPCKSIQRVIPLSVDRVSRLPLKFSAASILPRRRRTLI